MNKMNDKIRDEIARILITEEITQKWIDHYNLKDEEEVLAHIETFVPFAMEHSNNEVIHKLRIESKAKKIANNLLYEIPTEDKIKD